MGQFISSLFVPLQQLPGLYALPRNTTQGMSCVLDDGSGQGFPVQASFGGVVQLLYLGLSYALVLGVGANLISDGSELLLLVPSLAPFIGSIVLPFLGAVPDGCIVLFSGLGPAATVQKQLAVGVGALAGSTVMLLTLPLALSVFAGRVDIINGAAKYTGTKLSGKQSVLWQTGVEPEPYNVRVAGACMLVSTLPYFLIQGEAFALAKSPSATAESSSERPFALAGIILCAFMFAGYLAFSLAGNSDNTVIAGRVDDMRQKALKDGVINFEAFFMSTVAREDEPMTLMDKISAACRVVVTRAAALSCCRKHLLGDKPHEAPEKERFEKILRVFFNKYDSDLSGFIDDVELVALLKDLRLPYDSDFVAGLINVMDSNRDGSISFREFVAGIHYLMDAVRVYHGKSVKGMPVSPRLTATTLKLDPEDRPISVPTFNGAEANVGNPLFNTLTTSQRSQGAESSRQSGLSSADAQMAVHSLYERSKQARSMRRSQSRSMNGAIPGTPPPIAAVQEDDEDDEKEEIPEDLRSLSPEEQQRRILLRSMRMMAAGSVLVIFFSDPLVDVLSSLGELMQISSFYVSFVLAPLASNLSEVIASYAYAKKKTRKSITISMATLLGGVVLNNSFVLGIFLILVYSRSLVWSYSAETISIIVAEVLVFCIVVRKVQTVASACLALSVFPFTLMLVALLENVAGLD